MLAKNKLCDFGLKRAIISAGAALITGLAASPAAWALFPNSQKPPTGWTGPVFKLSQAYPTTLPSSATDTKKPWLQYDFTKPADAPNYMQAVLDYCMEGNVNLASPQDSFADISTNSVRGWYHAPWMHLKREFIHGMTNERGSPPKTLGPAQTLNQKSWAVGFYNPLGGYTLGQVWKDENAPDPSKAKFPEGSVSCKLIFTTATVAQAPYLDGSLVWQGNIVHQTDLKARPEVRLLQLDIAIKDGRAPGTGWVFGTFQYENAAANTAQWWKHMVPVGLMWGNDLTHIKANQPPTQQWINATRDPQLHIGFRGLLNGPIDNPNASCVACHGFAQVQKPSVTHPTPALPGNHTWSATMSDANIKLFFKQIDAATALSSSYQSLDFSLQLQSGVTQFRNAHQSTASAHAATGVHADTGVHAAAAPAAAKPQPEVTR